MGQTIYQIQPSSLQLQPESSFWLWLHKSNSFHSGLSKLISASSQSFSQDFPVIKVAIFDEIFPTLDSGYFIEDGLQVLVIWSPSRPITGQYSGHVTCLDQSERSIQVLVIWSPSRPISIQVFTQRQPIRSQDLHQLKPNYWLIGLDLSYNDEHNTSPQNNHGASRLCLGHHFIYQSQNIRITMFEELDWC